MDTNGKELIYHYTTGGALLGMLKDYDAESNPNLTMWATHYRYMNDPMEVVLGDNIFKNAISNIEEKLDIPQNKRIGEIVNDKFFGEMQSYLNSLTMSVPQQVCETNPFIVSFSEERDSLHMWSMYATDGNGIALAFDRKKLTDKKYNLYNCIYEQQPCADEELLNVLTQVYDYASHQYDDCDNEQAKYICAYNRAMIIFRRICPYIKHVAYQKEFECRILVKQKPSKILFREKNGLIIPYTEQPIPFDCLDSIIVGPTADFERAKESILMFLYVRGIQWDDKRIIQSEVPYRIK